jgi:hypothetical protein
MNRQNTQGNYLERIEEDSNSDMEKSSAGGRRNQEKVKIESSY